jgi:hypothetical protein
MKLVGERGDEGGGKRHAGALEKGAWPNQAQRVARRLACAAPHNRYLAAAS